MSEAKKNRLVYWFAIFSVFFYCIYFSIYTCIRHYTFDTSVFDLGIYNQAFWSFVHMGKFLVTLDASSFSAHNMLGATHFSLIYYVLVPFYWLFPKPETLLILQSFLLGLPGVIIYFLARQKTKNEFLALAFCLSYLLYTPVHNINLFDFHELACAPLLILSALYFLENKKYAWFVVFFILSLFIKEDVALSGIGIGMYIFLVKKQRWFGIIVALFSAIYFIATLKIFMPFLGSGAVANFSDRYSQMILPGHHGYVAILYTMITKPLYALKVIFWNKYKILYLFKILAPLLFLPLCNNIGTVILIVPSLLVNLLSSYKPQYNIRDQYAGVVIPFLYFTAILATQRMVSVKVKKMLAVLLIAIGVIVTGQYLIKSINNHWEDFTISSHDLIVRKMIDSVPQDASVSASMNHGVHLSGRSVAYVLPKGVGLVDYIFLDLKGIKVEYYSGQHSLSPEDKEMFSQILFTALRKNYGVVDFQDGCVLLKKGYSKKRNQEVLLFVNKKN